MLPSFRQAKQLVETTDTFISKKEMVNGHVVHHFDYMLSKPSDFKIKPYASELRGLVYVNKWFGLLKDRWPMLHKFHNLNECDGYLESDFDSNWTVHSINVKEDGSVVSFIKIGGKWVGKSHYSFESYQAKKAEQLLTPKFIQFLDRMLEINVIPIFELVGKDNPIVVKYNELELRLLQLRSKKDGEYFGSGFIDYVSSKYGIKQSENLTESFYDSYDDINFAQPSTVFTKIKELAKTEENTEGWVVRLVHNETYESRFVKIKTDWYLSLHGLMTGSTLFANNIIKLVLEGEIDDIITQMKMDEDDSRQIYINDIVVRVTDFYNHQYKEITKIMEQDSGLDPKSLFMKHGQNPYFNVISRCIKGKPLDDQLKQHILKQTNKKEIAEKFLESI